MKDYYKINEISKMYGIGVDSLRYYEKLGILKPHRDVNGYRLYNLKEMYKLNMIRDLRRLDFSMQQIKEYLDGQSVGNTLALLSQEEELVQEQMKELKVRERDIHERVSALKTALKIKTGVMEVRRIPARRCVQISEHITRDEEMDFIMKKLQRKHEDKIRDLGNQTVGAFLSVDDLLRGVSNVYDSVFFVLEPGAEEYDFEFHEGTYLSYFYRGDYNQNKDRVREVMEYAHRKGLCLSGRPFELYRIDNRDTAQEEEFLTEIQIEVV